MPASPIHFPDGATHARHELDGIIEIFPLGGEIFMDPDAKIRYGTIRDNRFVELSAAELAAMHRQSAPAFPIRKVSSAEAKNRSEFIRNLLIDSKGAKTIKEIAALVNAQFPEDLEKIEKMIRSTVWYLKQQGIEAGYKTVRNKKSKDEVGGPQVETLTPDAPSIPAPEATPGRVGRPRTNLPLVDVFGESAETPF